MYLLYFSVLKFVNAKEENTVFLLRVHDIIVIK